MNHPLGITRSACLNVVLKVWGKGSQIRENFFLSTHWNWQKCYFSKGQEFVGSYQKLKKGKTSCSKVWKLALNLAYHTCSPERELRKGESTKAWYPEYTLTWREVARRVMGGETTADPTEARGADGQLCSKAVAEWEEQPEPMEQEVPAFAGKADLVKDIRWDAEERMWSRVPASTAGSSRGALLPTLTSQLQQWIENDIQPPSCCPQGW